MKFNRNVAILCAMLAIILCLPMLVAIRASASSGVDLPSTDWDDYPYTNTSFLTPGGQSVNCRTYTSDFSDAQKDAIAETDEDALNSLSSVREIARPTRRYNCYSYAFYSRSSTTNKYVIMHTSGDIDTEGQPLYAYWHDAHFSQVPKMRNEACVGDVVLYYSSRTRKILCHAAVVSEVDSYGNITKVISKWGMSCLYEHGVEDVPRQYRVTGDTQGNGTVFYEVHGFSINHRYDDWGSISSSKHQRSCQVTGCTKTQTANHQITYSRYSSSKHYRQCSECNYKVTQSHSNSYASISDTQHRRVCDKCNYSVTQSHSNTYTSISNTQHRRKCSKCDNTATASHTFGPWKSDGPTGHAHTCSACSKKIVQAHIFNGTGCKICGYSGPGVLSIRALMQKYPYLME